MKLSLLVTAVNDRLGVLTFHATDLELVVKLAHDLEDKGFAVTISQRGVQPARTLPQRRREPLAKAA